MKRFTKILWNIYLGDWVCSMLWGRLPQVADVIGSHSPTLAQSSLCQDKCQPLCPPLLSRYQTQFDCKLQSSAVEVVGKVWFPDRRKRLFPGGWDSSKQNTLMRMRFFLKESIPTFYHLYSEVLQHRRVCWMIVLIFIKDADKDSHLGPSEGQTAVIDVCCLRSLHHYAPLCINIERNVLHFTQLSNILSCCKE